MAEVKVQHVAGPWAAHAKLSASENHKGFTVYEGVNGGIIAMIGIGGGYQIANHHERGADWIRNGWIGIAVGVAVLVVGIIAFYMIRPKDAESPLPIRVLRTLRRLRVGFAPFVASTSLEGLSSEDRKAIFRLALEEEDRVQPSAETLRCRDCGCAIEDAEMVFCDDCNDERIAGAGVCAGEGFCANATRTVKDLCPTCARAAIAKARGEQS